MRTALGDLGRELKRYGTRLVEPGRVDVGLSIAINQRLKGAVVRAELVHMDLIVAQQDFGINHPPAFGTNAAGEFVEDIVGIVFQVLCLKRGQIKRA